jgi:hypothetical protein
MVCEAWAAAGLRHPARAVFVFYALQARALRRRLADLLRADSPALGGPADRLVGAAPHRLPEGHRVEHALRGARPRLRQRPAHGPLPPAHRRLPLLPPPRHHQAPALPWRLPVLGAPTRGAARRRALPRLSWRPRVRASSPPRSSPSTSLPLVCSSPLLGVLDKTLFLAARSEHYWVTLVCFVASPRLDRRRAGGAARPVVLGRRLQAQPPLPDGGLRDDQQRPAHPLLPVAAPRMYRDFPRDLRPSRSPPCPRPRRHRAGDRRPARLPADPAGTPPWWRSC